MNATAALPIVGVDLAKSVFQLAIADANWRIVERQRLTRTQFERWFANRAVGLVVMEACGSAHHWARWLSGLGIEVRLLPAPYVRAYVKRNKTDAADAEALLEAARCADIVPVRVKSVDEQALQALHRTRSLWMATRTARINALRGFCREFGIAIAQGARTRAGADRTCPRRTEFGDSRSRPADDEAAGRGDPAARGARGAARARADANGACVGRVHDAADDSRGGPAHRHRDGRSHQRQRQPLPRCAALRRLVRPDAQGALLGQHASDRTHLQARGPLPADAPHPRGSLGAARSQLLPPRPAAPSTACAPGRSPCRGEPITTRRPARSPTSSRASATPVCATARPTGRSNGWKRRSRAAPIQSQPERAKTNRPTNSPTHRLRRD